jgi:uncharacterized protein
VAKTASTKFSPYIAERLGAYVYRLRDPANDDIFYIGKGRGNRVFAHAEDELKASELSDVGPTTKIERIREVRARGDEVVTEIVRHGLSDVTAFEIEAVLIVELRHRHPELLTNLVAGHGKERGAMTTSDVISMYEAPPAPPITERALLLRIPGLWSPLMTAGELYEATRGWWVIGPRRTEVDYAFAVSRGVVREVYRIDGWRRQRAGDRGFTEGGRERWGFDGLVADDMARYRHTDVGRYFGTGAANPVRYVEPIASAS